MLVYQRAAGAALILVAVQLLVTQGQWETLVRIVLPITLLLVLMILWVWHRHLGIWCMYVGLAANLTVLVCNGGLVPVERSTLVSAIGQEQADQYQVDSWLPGSKNVLVADGEGNLSFLGDSIVLRLELVGVVLSPGDIVILSGLLLVALEAVYKQVGKSQVRV